MIRPQIAFDSTDQQRVEEYADEHGLRMSRAYADLLTHALDETVGPTDEELRAAYRENTETAREINHEWEPVSTEANQYLADPPEMDDDALAALDGPAVEAENRRATEDGNGVDAGNKHGEHTNHEDDDSAEDEDETE